MLTIQRTESLRRAEGCNPPGTHLLPPVGSGASVSGWKPAERSVSFNRDVHVKRIEKNGRDLNDLDIGKVGEIIAILNSKGDDFIEGHASSLSLAVLLMQYVGL